MGSGLTPLRKSQVAIGFPRQSGTDPPREAIGPKGSNCFSRGVSAALCNCMYVDD